MQFKVYLPAELLQAFTAWANGQGYGVSGAGAILDGEVENPIDNTPVLFVWKKNNTPPPGPLA